MNLRLNFHSGAIIGSFSISWCGHLIHVAIAISRGYIAFLKLISNGFNSFYSAKWLFTSHLLTFLGGLNSKTLSTYLTDLAHHHVAMGIFFAWSRHVYLSFFKGFAHRLRDVFFVNGNSGLMILFHGKSVDLQLSLAYGGSCVILTRLHDLMLVVIIFCKRISLDFRLNISYCIFSSHNSLVFRFILSSGIGSNPLFT